jgi:hypothetical protein
MLVRYDALPLRTGELLRSRMGRLLMGAPRSRDGMRGDTEPVYPRPAR